MENVFHRADEFSLKWTNKNTKDLKGPIGAKQFLKNHKCPKWTQNGLKLQKT